MYCQLCIFHQLCTVSHVYLIRYVPSIMYLSHQLCTVDYVSLSSIMYRQLCISLISYVPSVMSLSHQLRVDICEPRVRVLSLYT